MVVIEKSSTILKTKITTLKSILRRQELEIKSELEYDESMLHFLKNISSNLERANFKLREARNRSISRSKSRVLSLSNRRRNSKQVPYFVGGRRYQRTFFKIDKFNNPGMKKTTGSEKNLRKTALSSDHKLSTHRTTTSQFLLSPKDDDKSVSYNSPRIDKKYFINDKLTAKENSHFQLTFNKKMKKETKASPDFFREKLSKRFSKISDDGRVPYLSIGRLRSGDIEDEISGSEDDVTITDFKEIDSINFEDYKSIKSSKIKSFAIRAHGGNIMSTERSLIHDLNLKRQNTKRKSKRRFHGYDEDSIVKEESNMSSLLSGRRKTLSYFDAKAVKMPKCRRKENRKPNKAKAAKRNTNLKVLGEMTKSGRFVDDKLSVTGDSNSLVFNLKRPNFKTSDEKIRKMKTLKSVLKESSISLTSNLSPKITGVRRRRKKVKGSKSKLSGISNNIESYFKENQSSFVNKQNQDSKKNSIISERKTITARPWLKKNKKKAKFDKFNSNFENFKKNIVKFQIPEDNETDMSHSEVIFDVNDYIISSESKAGGYL